MNASQATIVVFVLMAFLSTFVVIVLNQEAATTSPLNDDAAALATPSSTRRIKSKPNNTLIEPTTKRNDTISIPLGIEHFFWRGRQNRLIKLIKKVTKKHRGKNNTATTPILLNFTIRCRDLYDQLYLGTGNLVLGFYGMRLAVATGGMDLLFHCKGAHTNTTAMRQSSILSWLQGYYPAPSHIHKFSPYDPPLPTLNEAARGMGNCPLHYMSEAIRHDLRNMALQLVGPREHMSSLLPDNDTATSITPLIPNVDIDDVAVHFRCGDVVKGFNSGAYGIVVFESYRRYVSPSARTIGIVTTPFDESSLRKQDQGTARTCKMLVMGLVEYLQHAFPHSTIYIRNDPKETLALAYARLVMANQTFISPSTFSIFPAIASYGKSFVQRSNLTYFVLPIAAHYDDVTFMDGDLLSAWKVGMWFNNETSEYTRSCKMLQWLMTPYCTVHYNETNATGGHTITCGDANKTAATR